MKVENEKNEKVNDETLHLIAIRGKMKLEFAKNKEKKRKITF
jgi:hypothetical protein